MMRLLLALSLVVTGAGLAPAATAPLAPVAADVTASTTSLAFEVPTGELTVEQSPLVVVPEAEAQTPETGGEQQEPSPTAPAPSGTPAPTERVDAGETVVADVLSEDGRVVTPAVQTDDVQTIGVTWPAGAAAADLVPQARTLLDGEWSDWAELPVDDALPDAGTADAATARGGTDSFWVGEAEAVQLSFVATADGGPADLSLALVGTSDDSAASVDGAAAHGRAEVRTAAFVTAEPAARTTVHQTSAVRAAAFQTAVGSPAVISRAQWGARGQACAPDVAGTLSGAVVHHTAGSNSYSSVAEAMAQIRGDQAYHIDARGWCDIGYNFLVDKWGNIYEGRANSLTQAVIGVHASGANTGTVGVSMLGNYDVVPTTPAMIEAVGRIIGWRLAAYGVNPLGAGTYPSGQYLPRIIGHRDVASTACPGRYGYAQLGNIRTIASVSGPAMPLSDAQSITRKLYQDMLGRPADPGGVNGWSVAMMQGMPPAQVATGLATSAEYAYAAVDRAYRDVLGRAPDATGTATWTAAIMDGRMRSEDLRIWLFGSVEYFNISGQTNDAYVAALYSKMLGRQASPGDIAFWSPLVASKGQDAVVRGFWQSRESANIRVQAFYQQYLGRSADAAGMATWPPVLLARGEGDLRSQIVGSVEYRNQAVAQYS